MKRLIPLLLLGANACCGYAQLINPTVSVDLETRIDYQHDAIDGSTVDANSGFKGKYLNLKLTGQLTPKLSYVLLQRLNRPLKDASYFDATDYIYLNYRAGEHWQLSAGKQFVAIGGFEYDHSPIDVYRGSEFWNNIASHQMGVSATYKRGGNQLLAQVCTNPFNEYEGSNSNTYAYNLMWTGTHGAFNTIYSVNLIEYVPHHYINYFVLGHKLDFSRRVALELDYMNRAAAHQTFLFSDASVMATLSVGLGHRVGLFAKGTYDVNRSNGADFTVMPGTEMKLAGAGVEYKPLKDGRNTLRLHAFGFYSWGKNTNPDGALGNQQLLADVGVTWFMNVLKAGRK
jgi:hypothetical protein